jgi:hypothetical protein
MGIIADRGHGVRRAPLKKALLEKNEVTSRSRPTLDHVHRETTARGRGPNGMR